MRAPIDFIIITLNGGQLDEGIAKSLVQPVQQGIIKLTDVTIIQKNESEKVTSNACQQAEILQLINGNQDDQAKLQADDIEEVAELLEPGQAAAVFVIEQLWALDFKKALLNSGVSLLSEGRIHPDASILLDK